MIKVGLLGSTGKMGRRVEELLRSEYSDRAKLSCAPARGADLGALADVDVIVDFSAPDAVEDFVRTALTAKAPSRLPALVIGSTGWKADQRACLEQYSERGIVLQSANFSLGLLALLKTLREISPLLRGMGYEPDLTEIHHVHKKDAPSGTALAIEKAVRADGSASFPIQSIREGEVIGIHELVFQGPADRIVFRHEAQNRSLFARGAIETAIWLARTMSTGERVRGWVAIDEFLTHKTPQGKKA